MVFRLYRQIFHIPTKKIGRGDYRQEDALSMRRTVCVQHSPRDEANAGDGEKP